MIDLERQHERHKRTTNKPAITPRHSTATGVIRSNQNSNSRAASTLAEHSLRLNTSRLTIAISQSPCLTDSSPVISSSLPDNSNHHIAGKPSPGRFFKMKFGVRYEVADVCEIFRQWHPTVVISHRLVVLHLHTTENRATLWCWGISNNKKLSWCWQSRATRLEVSQSHQT